MMPETTERVFQHTAEEINERIWRQTEENVSACAAAGREAVDRRLREIDHEWDIERTLEANAATVALIGLGLGAFVAVGGLRFRRWSVDSCCSMLFRAGAHHCRCFVDSEFGPALRSIRNDML
jgi:hypothetical protein